jgi:2-phosphosulfolactate phosphatase
MDFPDRVTYAIIDDALASRGVQFFKVPTITFMVPTGQARVFVHLLPRLIPPGSLCGGIAVVVDVLRATTVMIQALASGCEAIIPCAEIEEAKEVAASLSAGSALLAGERQGLPIEGFHLGNSPGEFVPEVCRGKTLVITTTNGTRAILASRNAKRVYIAGFTNLRATSDEISVQFLKKDHGHSVHIICAGTEGHISLEDSLLAGALTSQIVQVTDLAERSHFSDLFGNDEAFMVVTQWLEVERFLEKRPLWKLLSVGRGGQNVLAIGRKPDIDEAAHFDRFNLVAELQLDSLKIVAV